MPAEPAAPIRVLYDISRLGFGHLYRQSRGGAYRADLHLSEGLAASPECELYFSASNSSVAYHGCEAFLRGHPRLGRVPLLGAPARGPRAFARRVAGVMHRGARGLFGSVLPAPVRSVARSLDRRLHRPAGAAMEMDIAHSSAAAPFSAASSTGSAQRFLTMYDLAFVRFPEIYGPEYGDALRAALASLRPGDHIITTSNFVRVELAAAGAAAAGDIHVVYLAADPAIFHPAADEGRIAELRRRYGIPEGPYLLGVNTPDRRKNVPHAIHAFARACHEAPGAMGSFVLAGHAGPGSDTIARAIAGHPELRGRILVTGYVPDEDVAALYSGAQQFIYTPIYEGFGLPPLEAMQCGTAVITSNAASLPEVVGEGGMMVDPHDLSALAEAMVTLATDPELRRSYQERGLAQARKFTWEKSTAATLAAYRSALGR